jgi:TfoX/Sxy family transcriptional regulator of competence genes
VDDLRLEFASHVLAWPDVTTKYMFGSITYLVKGRLFAFLDDDNIVITQLDEDSRQALASEYEAYPFQSKGKPVGNWMQVSVNDQPELYEIMKFVRSSYQAACLKSKQGK